MGVSSSLEARAQEGAESEAEQMLATAVAAARGAPLAGAAAAAAAALAAEDEANKASWPARKEAGKKATVQSLSGLAEGWWSAVGAEAAAVAAAALEEAAVMAMLARRAKFRGRVVDMAVHIAQTAAGEVDPDIMHDFIYRIPVETGYLRGEDIIAATADDKYFFYNMAIHEGGPWSLAGRDSRGHMYLQANHGDIIRFTYDLNNPYNKAPFWTDLGRFVNLSKYLGMNLDSYRVKDDDNLYTNFSGVMSGVTQCIEYNATPFIFQNYDKLTTFGGEDVCLKGSQIYVCNSNGIYSTDGKDSSTTHRNLRSIYWSGTDLYVSNGNQIVKNSLTYAGSATTSGQNGGLLTNAKFTTTKAFANTSGGVEYILDDTGIWRIQTEYVNEVFKPYGTNDAFAVNSLNMYVSSGGNVKEISLYSSTETNIPGVTNPKGITMNANNEIYVADNNAIYKKSSKGTTLQIHIPNTADNLMNSPIQYLKNNISEYVVCSNNIILITPPTADFSQISVISKNTGKNVMVNANLYTPTIDTRAGATTTYVSNTQLNQLKTGGNSFVPLNFLEIDLGKEFIIESIVYYIKPGQNINASLYFYDNKRIMSIDPIINYSLLNSVPTNLQQINYVFQNIYPITYTKARYIGVATTGKTSQVAVINSAGLNVALMRMTGAINPTDGTYENKSTPLSYSGTFTIDLGTEHEIRKVVYYNAVDALTTTDPVEEVLVSTIAGNGTPGFVNGSVKYVLFRNPISMVFDSGGNMYVSDHSNHCIRKITSQGISSRFAGSGQNAWVDGTETAASFNGPCGITIDSAGNIYVADQNNHSIRKITPGGVVSTIAGTGISGFSGDGGPATSAKLHNPAGVAVDRADNVYITDQANHRIRKVSNGIITTFAGSGAGTLANGTGTAASFSSPSGITIDSSGNLYIGDQWNHSIRKITTPGGVVSTIAGTNTAGYVDGTGAAARFRQPYGLVLDSNRNIYVGDFANNSIRKITQAGVVTTIAGSGTGGFINGLGYAASFNGPYGIAMDNTGSLYVAEWNNHSIRKLTGTSASIILINSLGIQVESRPFVGGLTKEVFDFRLSMQESGMVNLEPSKPVNRIRYVQYTPNEMAAIRQIVVYDKNGANIALGKTSAPAQRITDGVYKLNSPDTEIYPPLPATPSPPQSITIDLGAEYDITGVSIITTPNYIPRLIDSRVRLLNASSIQQQECILRGGNVREDILFTYTYNTMARYIRIENPLPSFFAANEYNTTSGSMNISSFEAYDIYGKNILEGKPYRFSNSSNYKSSTRNQVEPTYISTDAKWIEYDIGKDTAIYSVKLTSNKLSSNQEINHRFMKNAPIIFYNETRGQTRKYFFTSPYIPYVNGVATATILPYIHVINRGNFTLNTNPTERLDVRLENQITAQPFTFKTMGAGRLSFYFNIVNMYNVNPYTISVTNTRTGSSNTYTATTPITLSEPEYTITITFNGNENRVYYNACNAIQAKINNIRKWYDKETNVIMRNYERGAFTKTTSYTWWKMSYETVTAYYWSWTGVNVYMILLNNPWGNPLAKYGYPYGSILLEREPFRGIGYDIYGYRRQSAGILGFIFLIFTIILSFIPGMGIINLATGFNPYNYVMVNRGVWSAYEAALVRDAAEFARLEGLGAAAAAAEARLVSTDMAAEASSLMAEGVGNTELATIMTQIISRAVTNSLFTLGSAQMTELEKDRQTRLKYAAVSAAVAFNSYSISIGIDDEIAGIVAARGASAGAIAGEIQGQVAAGRRFTRSIDAIIDAADKGATAGAEAGGRAARPFPDALPAMAAGAAAGAAMAATTAARLVGLSYLLGDESAVGAIAAKAAITTRQSGIYGTEHMIYAASFSIADEFIKNQFDPLSHVRGPSWLWADYAVFGMRMARPLDIQEFVWEDGSIKEDDVTQDFVNKIKSRYISPRYLDEFKIYMTDTWNVLPRIVQKYDTSLVSLNAARDAVTLPLVKYISTNNSWIQINRIPVPSTNTNPSISSDLFPQLLSQSIATSFPDQQTSIITTGLTSVQYISFSFTSQIKLNQIIVIDKRGINVAAGKPLVLISNSSVNTDLTNGNYYTSTDIQSFVLDLGASYDVSTISMYDFLSTTAITLHIYKSDRTWHALTPILTDNQSLIQKGTDRYIIGIPSTKIPLYSIYFNNPIHDSCKPQHAGVGTIIRYITMSEMNIRVCVTDTAGQILWNDPINDELDLGEEHNIASIYVGNTAATIISLKNAYKIAVPIPVPSSIAGVTTGAPVISFTPTYKIYSFI